MQSVQSTVKLYVKPQDVTVQAKYSAFETACQQTIVIVRPCNAAVING